MRPPPAPPRTRQQYDIVSNTDHLMLIKEVNELSKDKWYVHGDLIIKGDYYMQPIVRTVEYGVSDYNSNV